MSLSYVFDIIGEQSVRKKKIIKKILLCCWMQNGPPKNGEKVQNDEWTVKENKWLSMRFKCFSRERPTLTFRRSSDSFCPVYLSRKSRHLAESAVKRRRRLSLQLLGLVLTHPQISPQLLLFRRDWWTVLAPDGMLLSVSWTGSAGGGRYLEGG